MAIQPSPRQQVQMPATVPTQEPAQLGMTQRLFPLQVDHWRWPESPGTGRTRGRGTPRVQRSKSDDGAWQVAVVQHWSVTSPRAWHGCG